MEFEENSNEYHFQLRMSKINTLAYTVQPHRNFTIFLKNEQFR